MFLGPHLPPPDVANGWHGEHVARVAASLKRLSGIDLIATEGLDPAAPGRAAWEGRFALLSHRGDAEATLNYANRLALDLWEMDWAAMTVTPSRLTAPPAARDERDGFMDRVARDGFVTGYRGLRISRAGKLFEIANATVWRLIDEDGTPFGVAAWFRDTAPIIST